MYSWLLVFVFLMAGGTRGGKRRRSSAQQPVEPPPGDEGSEYAPDNESETESVDWEQMTPEVITRKKGKEPAAPTTGKGKGKGKGKEKESVPYTSRRKSARGLGEASPEVPLEPGRRSMYSSKHCIGERRVDVTNLFTRVPGFQGLFESGGLHEICRFPEQTGYCLDLVREFYMRAGNLVDTEEGPFMFTTSVRGVELRISPDTIAAVLEMTARTDGVDYLHAGFDSGRDWRRVVADICVPGTDSGGIMVLSKDLKIAYRFLNFVVCYNVLPLANTKVLRWPHILYMFLLGHPELVAAGDINLNVPFLIWKRMARDIKTSSQKDRLPYPLIVMRILRMFNVDVTCTSYEHSLAPINETTLAKSATMLRQASAPREAPPPPAPAPAPSRHSVPSVESEEDISVSSVFREQQRISSELERISADQARITADQTRLTADQTRITADQTQLVTKVDKLDKKVSGLSRLLRVLCEKMGCGSSDLPPPEESD